MALISGRKPDHAEAVAAQPQNHENTQTQLKLNKLMIEERSRIRALYAQAWVPERVTA
jgi:hypothetical protein